jgi:hypothetical protein
VLEGATQRVTTLTETPPGALARSVTTYALMAISGINLSDHVGHRVEVTGTLDPKEVRSSTTTSPAGTQTTTTTALSRFRVSTIRMVSESCP